MVFPVGMVNLLEYIMRTRTSPSRSTSKPPNSSTLLPCRPYQHTAGKLGRFSVIVMVLSVLQVALMEALFSE